MDQKRDGARWPRPAGAGSGAGPSPASLGLWNKRNSTVGETVLRQS